MPDYGIEITETPPCPFCGSSNLGVTEWVDEDGEYPAIECCCCKAAAPADVWSKRAISEAE